MYLNATLPDNPTGVRQVGVSSTDLDCGVVARNPLVTCIPAHGGPQ
jgi:hypothetical protein